MKRLAAVALALAVVLGALYLIPSDHYLLLPDPARAVDPLVQVPGERRSAEEETGNGIYMVDILVRRANLLERVVPEVEDGASLAPAEAINPAGVSDSQRRQQSLNDMSRSQEVAVTVALRELGHRVRVDRTGAEVDTVVPGRPADGELEVGDVIVEARGQRVRSPEDLQRAMEPVRPGDEVELSFLRGDDRRTLTLPTVAAEDDRERAIVGVGVVAAATFDFPIDVKIDAGDIGGPSAGLAFALGVTDELGDDIDGGRRIAVTGTLDLDGSVGQIGGVKQKAIGARRANADLFLVPDENAEEARRNAEGLEIVAVSTFEEALEALEQR